jgi:putative SOS response-associated peptidase YedK
MINARADTVHEKPAYRTAFERRRCLIVADGFFEWQQTGDGKVPIWIHRADRRPFAFAGLWERWTPPEGGDPVHSCAIVTTEANDFARPVHERMPVILPREGADLWLDPAADRASLRALLRPYPHDDLSMHQVSALVNSPKNDLPDCIAPV